MLLLKEVPAIRKGGCQAKNCIFERKVLQSDRRSLKAAQAGMARTSSIFRSLFSEVVNDADFISNVNLTARLDTFYNQQT